MAEIKWIKMSTDLFDNRKIKQIESLPDGDAIIVIWMKLLCLAGNINDEGFVYFTKEIPYTDQMLATQFNRPLPTIQLALQTFQQFGMVCVIDNILKVSNWEKYQNIEGMERIREQNRIRKQEQRKREKLLIEDVSRDCHVTVTQCHATDIDIDKDIEEEKEKDKKKAPSAGSVYFPNNEELEKTFKDFIAMRKSMKNGAMTERAITMMINKLNNYDEQTAIAMLEQSILNNWKDVYELKQQKPQPKKKEPKFESRQYSDDYFKDMMRAEYRRLKEEIKGGGQ